FGSSYYRRLEVAFNRSGAARPASPGAVLDWFVGALAPLFLASLVKFTAKAAPAALLVPPSDASPAKLLAGGTRSPSCSRVVRAVLGARRALCRPAFRA